MARDHGGICAMKSRVPTLSSSAKADDPVRCDLSIYLRGLWNTGCPAFAGHDDGGLAEPPLFQHIVIGLYADGPCRQCRKLFPLQQLRQRPYRSTTDQRAFVIEQAFCLLRQGGLVRVADRDQHIANKTVAADALDR